MNNMKTTFGETLRELRKRQMMTQLDLEKKTGIKRSYIAQIETNQITTVSIPTVRRLADGLSVAVSDLVNAVGRDSNQPPAIIFTQARDAKDTTPEEVRQNNIDSSGFLAEVARRAKAQNQQNE